ncbi:Transposase zinc-ribbon domain protein [Candidatus Tiddalikarchaeum anstoanum]|nr:Transposase zinc-ribbon domain protein [Candidatus Tiddalikarchaeum anstoanum]
MEPKPTSITGLDFFTRQVMDPDGFAFMWVFRPKCPACKKGVLSKLKKRDKFYTCSECGKQSSLEEYGNLLVANVEYTCPFCKKKGEYSNKWEKPASKTAPIMVKFECMNCGEKLKVMRMKKEKKKKTKIPE